MALALLDGTCDIPDTSFPYGYEPREVLDVSQYFLLNHTRKRQRTAVAGVENKTPSSSSTEEDGPFVYTPAPSLDNEVQRRRKFRAIRGHVLHSRLHGSVIIEGKEEGSVLCQFEAKNGSLLHGPYKLFWPDTKQLKEETCFVNGDMYFRSSYSEEGKALEKMEYSVHDNRPLKGFRVVQSYASYGAFGDEISTGYTFHRIWDGGKRIRETRVLASDGKINKINMTRMWIDGAFRDRELWVHQSTEQDQQDIENGGCIVSENGYFTWNWCGKDRMKHCLRLKYDNDHAQIPLEVDIPWKAVYGFLKMRDVLRYRVRQHIAQPILATAIKETGIFPACIDIEIARYLDLDRKTKQQVR